ncbi:hypothetical protein B0T26DRAFT_298953 [Lasiosphaeria miniovina]|uniref:G domain-containing protein n=1 Tax=Lasiosphaeria miniovina TaxID=1954250 RepID=A0AA40AKI9_9PEZI|nr:uncharacterized protein B0T26DRAFT_298953 [Lasiosphaeria miniovina]KAK0717534.1 hypothetical protein B0T26DRAFT_298953 [Lasiosphaeria miniovina]
MRSVDHDINKEYKTSENIFHDSMGFEAGETATYDIVQAFLKTRRALQNITEQVHCMWYCISLDRRLEEADYQLFLRLDFEIVKVMLVLTKCDTLRAAEKAKATSAYAESHPDVDIQYEWDILPNDRPSSKHIIVTNTRNVLKAKKTEVLTRLSERVREAGKTWGINPVLDCYLVSGRFPRDPANLFKELLSRSRHVGEDLLATNHREAFGASLRRRRICAIRKAIPLIKDARDSFLNPFNPLKSNEDHDTEFLSSLHKVFKKEFKITFEDDEEAGKTAYFAGIRGEASDELKGVAMSNHANSFGDFGFAVLASNPVVWAGAGGLVAISVAARVMSNRTIFLIKSTVFLALVYDWCAWSGEKQVSCIPMYKI